MIYLHQSCSPSVGGIFPSGSKSQIDIDSGFVCGIYGNTIHHRGNSWKKFEIR
jgi:hypothetical protein